MKSERLLLVIACALACALMAEAVWRGPFLPTNDGPHHVFGAFARAHLDDPVYGYGRFLDGNRPTSSNAFPDLFGALLPGLGWRDAERATVGITAAIFLLACVLWARSFHPARAWLGFVAGAMALGWATLLGFYPFVLGTGLALLVLWFARRAQGAGQLAGTAALLLFLATQHFFVAALTAGLCVVVRACAAENGPGRAALAAAATTVPAFAVVWLATRAVENHGDPTEVLPFFYRATALGGTTVTGPLWKQLPFAALAIAGVASVAIQFHKRTRVERALAALAVAGFALPLLAPWTFWGWQHAAVRALPLCAALAIALVPLEALRGRLYPAAAAGCVVFLAASTLQVRALLEEAATDTADIAAALAPAPDGGPRFGAPRTWLSVVAVDPDWLAGSRVLRWDPLRALGSAFATAHGGLPAYAHVVSPQAHTVLLKPEVAPTVPRAPLRSANQSRLRRMDDPVARAALLAELLPQAAAFGGVVVFERPADHAIWRSAGFSVLFESGRVLVLEPPPLNQRVGLTPSVRSDQPNSASASPSSSQPTIGNASVGSGTNR